MGFWLLHYHQPSMTAPSWLQSLACTGDPLQSQGACTDTGFGLLLQSEIIPALLPTQLSLKKSLNYVCYQGKKASQRQYQSSFAACPSWPSGPEQGWLLPRHMDGDQDKACHHAANTGSHLTEAATSISTSLWH